MTCLTVVLPGGSRLGGHLIEEKAYSRVRDLAEALGYRVTWQPPGLVVIRERPCDVTGITDLRLPSRAPADLLDAYLVGTPLMGLGAEFLAAEERWGVNAVFACAVACHESDFGRSEIAKDKRNLFGIQAYDSDPYGSAKTYPSYAVSIEDFCRLVSQEYLSPGGLYYNGPSVCGVRVRYATDPEWGAKVLRHCQAILVKGE